MPTFKNPDVVYPPLGPYSHIASVPSAAELVFFSGQIGNRLDGSIGTTLGEQATQAFENIRLLLRAEGLTVADVIKLVVYIVAGQDAEPVRAARIDCFGTARPASTTLYVPALLNPDWLIEVDVTAARVASMSP